MNRIRPKQMDIIEKIIKFEPIIFKDTDYAIIKDLIDKDKITWTDIMNNDKYSGNQYSRIKKIINRKFDKSIELDKQLVCSMDSEKVISENLDDIKKSYKRYMDPTFYEWLYGSVLDDFFYLNVVTYSYINNHIRYIYNHGKDKKYLIKNKKLFDRMNEYIKTRFAETKLDFKIGVFFNNMIGEIDLIEKKPDPDTFDEKCVITEIKCTSDIRFKYILQLLIYGFFLGKKKFNGNETYSVINLLKGYEETFEINTNTKTTLFDIINIISKTCGVRLEHIDISLHLNIINDRSKRIVFKDKETDMVIIDHIFGPSDNINNIIEAKMSNISSFTLCDGDKIIDVPTFVEMLRC